MVYPKFYKSSQTRTITMYIWYIILLKLFLLHKTLLAEHANCKGNLIETALSRE